MRPLFHVVSNVWGDSHVDLFLDLTLPNVLSPGNLPALVERGRVVYRIFTTPSARGRIETSAIGQQLSSVVEVEYISPLGERTPDTIWHVHWFHRSAAEAKAAAAMILFVPPDTLWTDGSFKHMVEKLLAGHRGVACPFLLVSSETCVSDARGQFIDPATGILTVPPAAMWPFARRHLHPLQMLAMPGGPHARPAFELHWPVGGEGMISRYAIRELVAFDPGRCPITFLWNAGGPEDAEGVYFATDSDEMLMLSVDPIAKYFQNYIVDHACHPFDVSRSSLHPLNNTRQTRVFVSRSVRLHGHRATTDAWRRPERLATAAARDIRVGRAAMLLHEALTAHRCMQSAHLLSIGLLDTHLSRRWRAEPPLTVIATCDAALARAGLSRPLELTAPGRERELVDILRDHVIPGDLPLGTTKHSLGATSIRRDSSGRETTINGLRVLDGPIEIEGVILFVVDAIVSDRLRRMLSST
jgi:hypothetical protein